jgi:hypothetical protein
MRRFVPLSEVTGGSGNSHAASSFSSAFASFNSSVSKPSVNHLYTGATVCFIVRGATGEALAYLYFEEEPGRRSAARSLSRD